MKITLIILISFVSVTVFAQKINFDLLKGTWLCYKATQGTKDMTEDYKDHYATFKSDSTYIEERRYYYNTTKGTYRLNKKNKTISFKNLINTTKFPDAKVKMDDLVMEITLQDEIIVSLNKDYLIILLKGRPNTELTIDTKLYYKREQ